MSWAEFYVLVCLLLMTYISLLIQFLVVSRISNVEFRISKRTIIHHPSINTHSPAETSLTITFNYVCCLYRYIGIYYTLLTNLINVKIINRNSFLSFPFIFIYIFIIVFIILCIRRDLRFWQIFKWMDFYCSCWIMLCYVFCCCW